MTVYISEPIMGLMNDWPEVVSAADLARMIHVSRSYIARLCRKGTIPAKKLGATWMIRKQDADKWMAKQSKIPNAH